MRGIEGMFERRMSTSMRLYVREILPEGLSHTKTSWGHSMECPVTEASR